MVLKKKPLSKSRRRQTLDSEYYANTFSLSPYLSSRGYRFTLLYPTHRVNGRLMGPDYPQSHRPRGHVLVLLSIRARRAHLVEEMDYQATNSSVHHRPRLCLLCLLHLFFLNLLSSITDRRSMRG